VELLLLVDINVLAKEYQRFFDKTHYIILILFAPDHRETSNIAKCTNF
jgi:hypothetical protein